MEEEERRKRKNRIIIKDLKIKERKDTETVGKFLESEFKAKEAVKEVIILGGGGAKKMALVEFKSWKEKQKLMVEEKRLKGSNIYIEYDLSIEERVIQRKLRDFEKAEKEKGNRARVAYRKINIEGRW